jgi:hypothetical protein
LLLLSSDVASVCFAFQYWFWKLGMATAFDGPQLIRNSCWCWAASLFCALGINYIKVRAVLERIDKLSGQKFVLFLFVFAVCSAIVHFFFSFAFSFRGTTDRTSSRTGVIDFDCIFILLFPLLFFLEIVKERLELRAQAWDTIKNGTDLVLFSFPSSFQP